VENIQAALKSGKNTGGTLHEHLCTFFIASRSVRLSKKNVSEKIVEKIKTNIFLFIDFFR